VAEGGEEGEEHPAADEDLVGTRQEVLDDTELVAHLRSAEDDRVGTLRVLGQAVEDLDLLLDQESGRGRQDLGEVVDRGLLAVNHTEAVRHEHITELGELLGEGPSLRGVLGSLPRVEPQVLDHRHITVGQGGHDLMGGLPHRVAGEGDRLAEELRQALGDRRERVLRVGGAVGAAQVRARDDARSLADQVIDRRQRRAHAAIVRDDSVLERNVEVDTDDDTLACERTQRIEGTQSHDRQSLLATSSVRSTRRFE